jgi:hypothetical protein
MTCLGRERHAGHPISLGPAAYASPAADLPTNRISNLTPFSPVRSGFFAMCDESKIIDMNPLSKVRSRVAVCFNGAESMMNRSNIAIKVAQCIAEWSEIESVLGTLLALLLGVENKSARAMYTAVENRTAQTRMLMAAAWRPKGPTSGRRGRSGRR